MLTRVYKQRRLDSLVSMVCHDTVMINYHDTLS